MIDTSQPDSPGWWADKLLEQLGARQARLDRLARYFEGFGDLPEIGPHIKEAYRRFQTKSRTNLAELVVDAVRERMIPLGFRTGASGSDDDDAEAWRIWQANSLDADSGMVHETSLALSDAYVIVGPVDPDIGAPVITPEDPRQVITAHDPIRRRKVVAAIKAYSDPNTGLDMLYVYLPGEVWKASRPSPKGGNSAGWSTKGFEWVNEVPDPLPFNAVPVVRFANRPKLLGDPRGEFEGILPDLDRINHMILQRVVIATMQAFRQRAVSGLPDKDARGNEIDYDDIFRPDAGALWQLPPNAEIWESGQADISGMLNAVKADVQNVAAITRTPLFYLSADVANQSAEGASLAREGLVFKTGDRIVQASESWEAVMSLAFRFAGDTERANRPDLSVIWADPQRFSLSEKADAALKAGQSGVPWRTVMSAIWQFTPAEIARLETERAADALNVALMTPPPSAIRETITEPAPPVTPPNPEQVAAGAVPAPPGVRGNITPPAPAAPPPRGGR